LRILLVTPSFFPIVGGSEVLTQVLAEKLNRLGIKADVMTFNMDKKWYPKCKFEVVRQNGITIFKVPAINLFPNIPNPLSMLLRMNLVTSLNFTKLYKDYDVIHFIGEADTTLALISSFVRKPKFYQCVAIFEHGGIYQHYMFKRPFLKKIFRQYFPFLADEFIVYSDPIKKLLADLGGFSQQIVTLPLGVDMETFYPSTMEKSENIVLFVGRIDRIKGLHILLEALSYIDFPTRLVVIGPQWDEEYMGEIKLAVPKVNKKGLHQISFLGAVDHRTLLSWYQKALVVVCPYLYEPFSTVTLEALACGVPVVSTGAHIIETGSDGILISRKDPVQLAEVVATLLENKELRQKLGDDGRRTIAQNFSWDVIVRRLVCLYSELIKKKLKG
jgi:glycosyltransferase involved in cell wall biosynthesis